MYAREMSVREIQRHLQELYGTAVSPDLILRVTDAVLDEVKQWQSRPLKAVCPIIYLDALVVKARDQGVEQSKSAYSAIGVTLEGTQKVMGLWRETTEGARFWMKGIIELTNRGVTDMLIVCAVYFANRLPV